MSTRQYTNPNPARKIIDESMRRKLSVDAECDPRTIDRVLLGEPVRGIAGVRALRVLTAEGLVPDGEAQRGRHAGSGESVGRLAARVAAVEARLAQLEAAGAGGPEWLSQPAAGRIAGCSPSTIRDWQRRGLLSRGRRSRVAGHELRELLAGGKRPQQVADLAGEARAREAARQILGWSEEGAKPTPSPGAK